MASLKESVALWHEGAEEYKGGNRRKALEIWRRIEDPSAKICYNEGAAALNLDDLRGALTLFDNCISKDEHLAIAYFQRGVCLFKLGRHREALTNFTETRTRLRDNVLIDYRQLGMTFKLCLCEIQHNRGLAASQCNDSATASKCFAEAHDPNNHIFEEHEELATKKRNCPLRVVDPETLFVPPRKKVAGLKKKTFMATSKVQAAVFDDELSVATFDGGRNLRRLEDEKRKAQKKEKKAPPARPAYTANVLKKLATTDPNLKMATHKAEYDYEPVHEGDLAIEEGDLLRVEKELEDGWAEAMNLKTREEGVFPISYAKKLPRVSLSPAPSSGKTSPKARSVPTSPSPSSGAKNPLNASILAAALQKSSSENQRSTSLKEASPRPKTAEPARSASTRAPPPSRKPPAPTKAPPRLPTSAQSPARTAAKPSPPPSSGGGFVMPKLKSTGSLTSNGGSASSSSSGSAFGVALKSTNKGSPPVSPQKPKPAARPKPTLSAKPPVSKSKPASKPKPAGRKPVLQRSSSVGSGGGSTASLVSQLQAKLGESMPMGGGGSSRRASFDQSGPPPAPASRPTMGRPSGAAGGSRPPPPAGTKPALRRTSPPAVGSGGATSGGSCGLSAGSESPGALSTVYGKFRLKVHYNDTRVVYVGDDESVESVVDRLRAKFKEPEATVWHKHRGGLFRKLTASELASIREEIPKLLVWLSPTNTAPVV